MFEWLQSKLSGWKPPEATGPSVRVQAFGPSDPPISASAEWQGDELEVRSEEAATKSLFDVELPNAQHCLITYRFRIRTENLQSAVYPEMWCRIPERGQFFSRGVDRKVRGDNDWVEVEIPFYLLKGQVADLLHLNLVFEAAGQVWLKDIEVTRTPLD